MSTRENISRFYLIKRGQTVHRAGKQQYMLEYRLNNEPTIDAPYLARKGEVWGVCCEFLETKWPAIKSLLWKNNSLQLWFISVFWNYPLIQDHLLGPYTAGNKLPTKTNQAGTPNVLRHEHMKTNRTYLDPCAPKPMCSWYKYVAVCMVLSINLIYRIWGKAFDVNHCFRLKIKRKHNFDFS